MIKQMQPVLGLQPARLGAHLEHADRRRVVDEHARLGQRAERVRQPAVVLLVQVTGAEPVRIDPRLGRQHAHEELLFRHLEAEEPDRHVGRRADMLRDVQHEAGLSHRRTRRDQDRGPTAASPDVISSRSTKPVGTPVTSPLCCCSFSIVAKLLCTRSRSGTKPARIRSSAIAKICALGAVEQQVRLVLRVVRIRRGSCWPNESGCAASIFP